MMTDPLMWSPLSLGRWFGASVRVHFLLLAFLVWELLNAAFGKNVHFAHVATWLGLLLLALVVHELGHIVAAAWLNAEPDEVRLWPLGNFVGPALASKSNDLLVVTLAGPLANAVVVVVTAIGLSFAHAQFVWNPFGNAEASSGAPWLYKAKDYASFGSAVWIAGWFGYLNYVLLLANLMPALPFDMGRVLSSYARHASVTQAKDSLFVPYTARTWAIVLGVAGVVRLLLMGRSDGVTLICLALLIELIVRSEARMMEDGGFYDDGVFGYDFSEGYTSLEGSAAKVRPYRESAIKRWRRRRSELRRQRRLAREAAEERRMDEILEKLHREGRHSLTDEEHRFLVRVSTKYRNRPKAHE